MASAMRLSVAEHRRLRRNYNFRRSAIAYLFLLPNLIFFVAFLVIPFFWVLVQSFQEDGILKPATFVGLKNWRYVLSDPVAMSTIVNTLLYMLMAIPTVFVIALGLALLLKRVTNGVGFFRAAIY